MSDIETTVLWNDGTKNYEIHLDDGKQKKVSYIAEETLMNRSKMLKFFLKFAKMTYCIQDMRKDKRFTYK